MRPSSTRSSRPPAWPILVLAGIALSMAACASQPDGNADAHLARSDERRRAGDPAGALDEARAARALAPQSNDARSQEALVLIDMAFHDGDRSKVEQARALAAAVFEEEPEHGRAWLVTAKIALLHLDFQAAALGAQRALEADPDDAGAWYVLGQALMLLPDREQARHALVRAIYLDPGHANARRFLATLHADLGSYEDAIDEARAVLREEPGETRMRLVVASSLARLERFDEALAELEGIPERDRDAEVLYALAQLYGRAGDEASARAAVERADSLRPHDAEILQALMALDVQQGRLQESVARIAAAREAHPKDYRLALLAGGLAMLQGDVVAAEESFHEAIDLEPRALDAYEQLTRLYRATDRLEEALAAYQQAVADNPTSARLHGLVGMLHEMRGETYLAKVEYETALELDPDLPVVWNNLAYILAETDQDLDRALELAERARREAPQSANVADTMGWVLYKRGAASAAVVYLREAAANLEPDTPSLGKVQHHLALAYAANGQRARAVETLENALAQVDAQLAVLRQGGGDPPEPDWTGPARATLSDLQTPGVATGPPEPSP